MQGVVVADTTHCSMGACFLGAVSLGYFVNTKSSLKIPNKQTNKIPLGLKQSQTAEINYPD